jgi:hypothetical protein
VSVRSSSLDAGPIPSAKTGPLARLRRFGRPAPAAPAAALPQDLGSVLAFLNTVSRACAAAATPEAATESCLSIVAGFTGWPIAHAYRRLPDGDAGTPGGMTSMRVWHLAPTGDPRHADAFVAASEQAVFAPGQGLVGRVAASGAPVSCPDCTVLPGFVRAETARRNGVRGCFMFPVRVGDGVEIVLEFFSRETAELKPDLLELMAYVADRLAQALTEHAQRSRVAALMRALDGIGQRLAGTTVGVEAGAQAVLRVAETVDARRGEVDRAATEAAHDIDAVARSAQDLVALSREAGDHAARVGTLAGGSAARLGEAVGVFSDLEARIAGVGRISDLIGTIARQTNLLALNATIEAARAGEAGRGFSVVAAEVKALSNRVSQATAEIGTQIAHLRQGAARSTESLSRVRDEIETVQSTAGDILRVSGAHRDAAGRIADGVSQVRTTLSAATQHLDALRTTTDEALAQSQTLGGTSGQLRDQGRELGEATRELARSAG